MRSDVSSPRLCANDIDPPDPCRSFACPMSKLVSVRQLFSVTSSIFNHTKGFDTGSRAGQRPPLGNNEMSMPRSTLEDIFAELGASPQLSGLDQHSSTVASCAGAPPCFESKSWACRFILLETRNYSVGRCSGRCGGQEGECDGHGG